MYKGMRGVFKYPRIQIRLKKEQGYPYFIPTNYNGKIMSIRKLEFTSDEQFNQLIEGRPWLNTFENRFRNLPMVRRSKDRIIKLFGNYYWVQIGWPIKAAFTELGWKDKFDTPRFEWCPAFNLYFFGLQFQILFAESDKYWEEFLWYYYYSDRDIVKAKETWGWRDAETKESTWKDDYLII